MKLTKWGDLFTVVALVPSKDGTKKRPIDLGFDTATGTTIIDPKYMEKFLGYDSSMAVRRSRLDGAIGESRGYTVRVSSFKCLGFEIADFEIACHVMSSRLKIPGLLGMDFLKHFRIDIDYSTGIIHKIEKVK